MLKYHPTHLFNVLEIVHVVNVWSIVCAKVLKRELGDV